MEKVEESVENILTQCCSESGEALPDGERSSIDVQVIEWDEFHNSLARLCGLATVLTKARVKREQLAQNVESLLKIRSQSLERVDTLETLQRKLQVRQKYLEDARSSSQENTQQLMNTRRKLMLSGGSLLHSARNLSAAQTRLQEAGRLLTGEGGHGRLLQLKNILTARRRCMIAQLAALYPLVPCTSKQKCPAFAHAQQSGDTMDCIPMTISGLHVIAPVKKAAALFTDKRGYETSATALGYVAHVASLLARYLDIRLRYPIRFRASRSYMQDLLPANEPVTSSGAIFLPALENQVVEFPLFSDGQDPTRAAYAVFLLNKDLEQILHHLEVDTVGPRHVLPNLHRILRTIFEDGRLLA